MVATVVVVRNLLCDQIHTSLIILIHNDRLSGLAILLLLVCLILSIAILVDDILCMIQEPILVECVALTTLPGCTTADIAKLMTAQTSHMVAAVGKLNHSTTALTASPTLQTCCLDELLERCILRTVAKMGVTLAERASTLVALSTSSNVSMDCLRRNECTASHVMAICPVGYAELDILRLKVAGQIWTDQALCLRD
jgi:hypothetical protein